MLPPEIWIKHIMPALPFLDIIRASVINQTFKKYVYMAIEEIPDEYWLRVTDKILQKLQLKTLNLSYNDVITDDGIKHMMPTTLNLCDNYVITDDGIKHMMPNKLKLRDNNVITNEGIKHMMSSNIIQNITLL